MKSGKKRRMNKKGQQDILGMVMIFFIAAVVLAFITIAMFLILSSFSDGKILDATKSRTGTPCVNESITLDDTAEAPGCAQNLSGVSYTTIIMQNDTFTPDGGVTNLTTVVVIETGNFSVSNENFTVLSASPFNGSVVNISAGFTHEVESNSEQAIKNVTDGTTNFFASIGSVFSVLIAAIIIMAVILIIVAIVNLRDQSGVGTGGGGLFGFANRNKEPPSRL